MQMPGTWEVPGSYLAILAWVITREHMSRLQVFGVVLAVIAIMPITI
jgi:EamA domain-containing membrane protein RarD